MTSQLPLFCFVFNSVAFINTKVGIVSESQFIVKLPRGEVVPWREMVAGSETTSSPDSWLWLWRGQMCRRSWERNLPKICPRTLPAQCLHHENSQSSKVFLVSLKITPRSFKGALKSTCDFTVEQPTLATALCSSKVRRGWLLEGFGIHLNFCFLFPFGSFNRCIPVGGV